jgi:(p)ppGpp synthase/HD superfamily hydrolase
MELSERYQRAVAYAAELHRDQRRKGTGTGTDVPYLSHLLAVSGLVLEFGGTEDEAIAALLHDALEDQADRTSPERIEEEFGAEVLRIVLGCSELSEHTASSWRLRKGRYLAHLRAADRSVLRVGLADKLHNARSVVTDLRSLGTAVWDRFNAGGADQLWYYGELAAVFGQRWCDDERWPREFETVVDSMVALGRRRRNLFFGRR